LIEVVSELWLSDNHHSRNKQLQESKSEQTFHIMGSSGSSHYKSHAEREADRHRREQRALAKLKRKQDRQAKKYAEKVERDAWLRNFRRREMEKKWWNVGWWPVYQWWKEKSGWEEEVYRRRKEGLLDSEGVSLRAHHD